MSESEFGGAAAARLFKSRMQEHLAELRSTKWTKDSPEILRARIIDIARSSAWVSGCTSDVGDALAAFAIDVILIDLPSGTKALAIG